MPKEPGEFREDIGENLEQTEVSKQLNKTAKGIEVGPKPPPPPLTKAQKRIELGRILVKMDAGEPLTEEEYKLFHEKGLRPEPPPPPLTKKEKWVKGEKERRQEIHDADVHREMDLIRKFKGEGKEMRGLDLSSIAETQGENFTRRMQEHMLAQPNGEAARVALDKWRKFEENIQSMLSPEIRDKHKGLETVDAVLEMVSALTNAGVLDEKRQEAIKAVMKIIKGE